MAECFCKHEKVQEAITERLIQIEQHIVTLSSLNDFSFEAIELYKDSLDINSAISEGQRLADIQKRKFAEASEKQQIHEEIQAKIAELKGVSTVSEPVQEDGKTWLRFKALMSVEEAMALKRFFEDRNITFGAI